MRKNLIWAVSLVLAGAVFVAGTNLWLAPSPITPENGVQTMVDLVTGQTPTICDRTIEHRAVFGDWYRDHNEKVAFRERASKNCAVYLAAKYRAVRPTT